MRSFHHQTQRPSADQGPQVAIARRAVEGHGGRVEVEDAPGGGTIFRIVLPAAP